MAEQSHSLNSLLLRPFPSTAHDTDRLSSLERLDIIINNLEQNQRAVREQIILQALVEKDELDKAHNERTGVSPDAEVSQPNLDPMRSKWRPAPADTKPVDARVALKKSGHSLFVEQQSHAALVKDIVARLEHYEKGTPSALKKFKAIRERINKEEEEAAKKGSEMPVDISKGGAGSRGAQLMNSMPPELMAAPGYDASRDPRRRRG